MAGRRVSHLRNSILFTSLFTIIGILAIYLPLSYTLTSRTMERNAILYTEQLLNQIRNSVEFYTDEMIGVSDYLASSETVETYLKSPLPTLADRSGQSAQTRMASDLMAIAGTREDFVNILLFRLDGAFVSSRAHVGLNPYWDYTMFDWYQETLAAGGRPVMSSSRVENIIAGERRWVVSLSRAIYQDNELLGVLLIDLNYKTISDICNSLSRQDGYVFIIGADERLVYHPQQQLIYSRLKSERLDLVGNSQAIESVVDNGLIYSSTRIDTAGWVIVSVFDTNSLVTVTPTLVLSYIGIGLFFALIALLVSLAASKRLTDPILSLKNSMQRFQQGDFSAKAEIAANNEIAELGDQFNVMTTKIKNLIENSILIEEQKRKSEIQALQSQIRPHFLYNTLESIIWMASMGKPDEVIEMTSSLSKLMRASASKADELVTLRVETEYAQHYLSIQKMRYQDKLEYRIEVQPEAATAKILRLTLQPLVENAIYHGIKPLRGKGLVVIQATIEGTDLVVGVADNGVGFPAERASQILERGPGLLDGENESIGLGNVHNRIRLFFGNDYGIRVQSAAEGECLAAFAAEDGIRTIVSLRLPLFYD
jgi:two-component system sensor histidine kinase YesM